MAGFNLTIDLDGQKQLGAMLAFLSPTTFERALKGGVQYAAKATPPAISKAVGARYNWKATSIKSDIKGPRFVDGGTTAIINLSRRPRTAAQFGGKPASRWYGFTIIKGERQKFRRGFVARGAQGIELPFFRVGKSRLPIEVIHGPSLGSVFMGDSRFGDVMKKEVESRMAEQFIKGIERELARKRRGF